jgi:hypothetical protein
MKFAINFHFNPIPMYKLCGERKSLFRQIKKLVVVSSRIIVYAEVSRNPNILIRHAVPRRPLFLARVREENTVNFPCKFITHKIAS